MSHPTVAIHLTLDPTQCKNAWYVARGTDPIPQTVPVNVHPFAHPLCWNFPPAEVYCK